VETKAHFKIGPQTLYPTYYYTLSILFPNTSTIVLDNRHKTISLIYCFGNIQTCYPCQPEFVFLSCPIRYTDFFLVKIKWGVPPTSETQNLHQWHQWGYTRATQQTGTSVFSCFAC